MHLTFAVPALAIIAAASAQSIAGKCTGQSCYIAELATSTEQSYKIKGGAKPAGGNRSGDTCIKSYYQKFGLPPPEGLRTFAAGAAPALDEGAKRPQDDVQTIRGYLEGRRLKTRGTGRERERERRQGGATACKPNTLVFAKGTLEGGPLGASVGPALVRALGSEWETVPVIYENTRAGIDCIGMPGGYIAKGLLNSLNARCPNTNIIAGGYSQGAMVARIGVAWANEATKKQVKGLLLYGDPFNGASVKGVPQDKVKVLCNDTDGVCKGELSIGIGHLSYTSNGAVKQGADWAKAAVKAAA